MTLVGNFFLFLAFLLFVGLTILLYSKTSLPGGDAAVSYLWAIIFYNLAILDCLAIVAGIIGWNNGFAWVASAKSAQFFWVSVSLLSLMTSNALSGLFLHESGPIPDFLRFLYKVIPILIPIVLIGVGLILNNPSIRINIPVKLYSIPAGLLLGLSAIVIGHFVFSLIKDSNLHSKNKISQINEDELARHNQHLEDIRLCDVTKDMVFILVFTDKNHEEEVRQHALEKIYSYVGWQQELIRLLQCDWAPEAFTFLASNDVDDLDLFLEPVHQAVKIQAKLIRQDIRNSTHSSHLYPEKFRWEVERMLRTVDKFSGKGIDFIPAIQQVRSALNEPTAFEKPKFECVDMLDKWIKTH